MIDYLPRFHDSVTYFTKVHSKRILKIYRRFSAWVNSLALFSLFLPVFSFASPIIADDVVSNLKTDLTVMHDGQKSSFSTERMYLSGALLDSGIYLSEKDVVFPGKETVLKGGEVTVEVKRALPFLVSDQGKETVVMSGYSDPLDILKQNNFTIFPEDRLNTVLIEDPFKEGSAGQKIIIERAPVIFVKVDGETKEFRAWDKTVGDLLKEKGVLIGNKDQIEPDISNITRDKMEITITRVAESEVTETETVDFSEKVIEDVNTFIGKDYLKQSGVNGTKEKTYKLISKDGVLESKTLIGSTILKEPIQQIRVKGVKPYDATTLWPTIVAASEKFGVSASKMHGVMICESHGNPYAGGYYKGLFQYSPDTWAGASAQYPGGVYAGASIYDPIAQIYVTAWKVSKQGWGAWGCA